MPIQGIAPTVDIAVSGLRAQSLRLKLITANIANANTTRTPAGGPYRRQDVVLTTGPEDISGVTQIEIARDSTALRSVYMPGHPDADPDGYVQMPNVELPIEMMNMVSASRAYEANVAALKRYQDMVDATIELLR